MGWVIGIIIVVLLFASFSSSGKAAREALQKGEEREKINRRVAAYADYFRREPSTPEIQKMTDKELVDFLHTSIESYKNEEAKIGFKYGLPTLGVIVLALGWGAVTLSIGGPQWEQAGIPVGFALVPVGIIVLVAWWTGDDNIKKHTAILDKKYQDRGLDVARLRAGLSHLTQQLQHEGVIPAGSFQLCSH